MVFDITWVEESWYSSIIIRNCVQVCVETRMELVVQGIRNNAVMNKHAPVNLVRPSKHGWVVEVFIRDRKGTRHSRTYSHRYHTSTIHWMYYKDLVGPGLLQVPFKLDPKSQSIQDIFTRIITLRILTNSYVTPRSILVGLFVLIYCMWTKLKEHINKLLGKIKYDNYTNFSNLLATQKRHTERHPKPPLLDLDPNTPVVQKLFTL